MKQESPICVRFTMCAAAIALAMSYGFPRFAQAGSETPADQAREAQIKQLKARVKNLQGQLDELQAQGNKPTVDQSGKATNQGGGCCAGSGVSDSAPVMRGTPRPPQMVQAGGGEHPMGGGTEGMEGEMGGGGTMGGASASPQASPGMPMEGHMKGMEHMHGMMHGGEANPAASPGAMPMEHGMPMEHPMGGMGGGGMGGEGMQGGAGSGAQPQASPGSGGMH